MRKVLYIFIGALLLVFGCQKNEVEPGSALTILTASSSQAEPESKVSIDVATMTTTTWSNNDEISVFTSSGVFKPFSLISGEGEKTGKFAATLDDKETVSDYAIYPSGSHSYSGGTLKVNLPATYSFVEGVSNIPMISTVDDSHLLHFKHCGGVIRFAIENITVRGSFVFKCYTHKVTGDFNVSFNNGVPQINAIEDSNGSVVTITFDKPASDKNLYYFYVPVPVGSYTDFEIEIRNEDGELVMHKRATKNNNVVGRGNVLKMRTISQPTFSGGNEGA